ncbi:hypothetical protein cce_3975 [Crocosphaera subtropica ATCC 51142]|uniref:Uncharacterized protein n=1 Tax=Crocosphaera subtropica (strain ATCC 51142 / BH68) TaxID=43989 RepID=B1WQ08_CROS5|nr:hypothetical protein cce_3975 [Crocosphaera subtropica ATCC 51142]
MTLGPKSVSSFSSFIFIMTISDQYLNVPGVRK